MPRATPISVALDERLATVDARLRAALRRPNQGAAGLLYSGSTASTVLLAAAAPGATIPITVDVEQDASELTRSESAATWLGHARQLELAAPDAMTLAGEFASHVHEPIADPSAIVQLAVLRAARRHADSAFAAHGASILWAGLARHHVERHRGRLHGPARGEARVCHWDDQHRRGIYTRQFSWQVREADPFSRHLALHASHPSEDPLERALYVDLRTSLADNVLACADRAAAAAGMSLRFPFLDRDLVVLAATTPSAVKQRGATGIHALRRLLLRQVPRTLMPPAGPQAPRHDWLRAALAAMVPAMLLSPRFDGRGIVSRVALRRIWEEHRSGRHDHASAAVVAAHAGVLVPPVRGQRRRRRTARICRAEGGGLTCVELRDSPRPSVLGPDERHRAQMMRDVLVHRGPDGAGLWADEHAALAHRRLSIVDLAGGHQPLSNETGAIWVTFNGEIYNHADVRAELEAAGHRYRTRSDTETIVHAYEQWGDECVQRFRGMFAFGIWDAPKRRLLLVRDRLGVKPLYWAQAGDRVLFASEIKAILESGLITPAANNRVLSEVLATRYTSGTETLFEGIYKLLPGHRLVFEHGRVRIEKYWDLPLDGPDPELERLGERELIERFRSLLQESVRLRLMADVPLGMFLSGGIDSARWPR